MNIFSSWVPWEQSLSRVPAQPEVAPLAERVRSATGQRMGRLDLQILCKQARARVHIDRLGGGGGGQEALLAPLPGNRFGISVDPTPRGGWRKIPAQARAELKRHRIRFRIGHELGHTFFYSRELDTPKRQVHGSPEQESFCDAFSRELLVPRRLAERAKPTPVGVLKLQSSCDVSLELAARAVSGAQPGLPVALWFAATNSDDPSLQWAAPNTLWSRAPDPSAPNARWLPERRQLLVVG